jgi:hypothetical protein
MKTTLTKVLLEIAEAGERLQSGKKKLIVYRTNRDQQEQHPRLIKLIDDFAINCGFTVQEMAGCKLLTKK